jgi:hypothetical protein
MKRNKVLTAAVAAAVLSGASAMAQFSYQNGDLMVAFGNGGATDVIVNLGSISSFQQGNAFSEDLSGVLDTVFGSVNSSVYWSVFGVNDTSISPSDSTVTQTSPYTVWGTLARSDASVQNSTPNVSGNVYSQHQTVSEIKTVSNLTSPSAASSGLIVNYTTPGIVEVSTSLGGFSSLVNSSSNPLGGDWGGTWAYNMLNEGAGVSDFYQNDPGNPLTTSATYLGDFSLSSSGVLTFNPVPEPSTWAMMGSGFLALLAIRRRK